MTGGLRWKSILASFSLLIGVTALSQCTSPNGNRMDTQPDSQKMQSQLILPRPLVVAHRGSSGVLPEHTLAAYTRAIKSGADFVEPDLVITRDGHLIARHENELSLTTDVAAKFPERRTRKKIDGHNLSGWFAEDFTLEEIKTLRARQRFSFRPQEHNDVYEIPTFEEILQLVQAEERRTGRPIGIYPETKHPSYFRSIGLPLEDRLLALLRKFERDQEKSWVLIQSFETENLKALAQKTSLPLIQLIERPRTRIPGVDSGRAALTYADLLTPQGLQGVAEYASGIGIGKASATPELVAQAHQAGLWVHVYTFRNEARYIGLRFHRDPVAELLAFYRMGIDGVFADFPATALEARDRFIVEGADGADDAE